MADDWKIKTERERCVKPGCPLAACSSYYVVLEFPECARKDLCDACFTDYERRCGADEPPVFWRAMRKVTGSKEPVLDLMSLRALFERLAGVADDRARALRYFCALLLIRKRVLRMVRPRTKAQERADLVVMTVPKQKDEEPQLLFAPEIDPDNLDGLKQELMIAIGEGAESPADQGVTGEPVRDAPEDAGAEAPN